MNQFTQLYQHVVFGNVLVCLVCSVLAYLGVRFVPVAFFISSIGGLVYLERSAVGLMWRRESDINPGVAANNIQSMGIMNMGLAGFLAFFAIWGNGAVGGDAKELLILPALDALISLSLSPYLSAYVRSKGAVLMPRARARAAAGSSASISTGGRLDVDLDGLNRTLRSLATSVETAAGQMNRLGSGVAGMNDEVRKIQTELRGLGGLIQDFSGFLPSADGAGVGR